MLGVLRKLGNLSRENLALVGLWVIGAGLPIVIGLAGESKTYAERLFNFPEIGALSKSDLKKALQDPVEQVNVTFSRDA